MPYGPSTDFRLIGGWEPSPTHSFRIAVMIFKKCLSAFTVHTFIFKYLDRNRTAAWSKLHNTMISWFFRCFTSLLVRVTILSSCALISCLHTWTECCPPIIYNANFAVIGMSALLGLCCKGHKLPLISGSSSIGST
jgi:hypothetical protein